MAYNVNPVSVEELRRMFIYEPETGELSWRVNVPFKNGRFRKSISDTALSKGYLSVIIGEKHVLVHRICWAIHYGEWPIGNIDHKNIVRTDNRIENLRRASNQQNGINKRCYIAGKPKGVTFKYNGWRSQIGINRKCVHLGMFATEDEAAHAYNKAAIAQFGEYAVLNPIGKDKE